MKYKNTLQHTREKFLKQKPLSGKEKKLIDNDFCGKDYAYYQSMKEDKTILPERYSADATFRKIEQVFDKKYPHRSFLKYAAAVVLIILVAFNLYRLNNQSGIMTVSTSYGEKKQVTLPDGSMVVLNSLSSVSYPKTMKGDTREVVLEGEAFFDVVKDPGKAFIVKAQQIEIRVLGTKFNVSAYADDEEIVTNLYEGTVVVALDSGETFRLQPGDQAVYNKRFKSVDIESLEKESQSWVDCSLCFNRKPLKEIWKILAREKNVLFEISDQINNELRITANFSQRESIEDLLEILGQSGEFTFEKAGNTYIIKNAKY